MKFSLAQKVILPIIILNFLVFIAQLVTFKSSLSDTLNGEFLSKGRAVTKSLANSVQDTLLNRDASTIQGFIDQYRDIRGVEYIFIINDKKEIAAHTFSPAIPDYFKEVVKTQELVQGDSAREVLVDGKRVIDIQSPILAGLLGRVYIGMGIEKIEEKTLIPLVIKSFFLSGILAIIGITASIIALYRAIRPVTKLTKTANEIVATGNLNLEIKTNETDEIGDLSNSFNEMIKNLKDHQDNLESLIEQRTKVIEQQQMKLVEASKLSSLGEMAGGIAHEINNPLAIISATAKTLEKIKEKGKLTDEFFDNALKDINNTVERIKKIVQGMRNISRDSENDDNEDVVINEILEDVLGLCSEKLKNNNVQFKMNIDDQIKSATLNCNRVQVSQVILNLTNNAFDEVQELDEKWVELSSEITEEYFIVKVVDSGNGIDEALRASIFKPFYTSKDIGKGTGLGLSISRSIMKNHGGSLEIDTSHPNTCFLLKFKRESLKLS